MQHVSEDEEYGLSLPLKRVWSCIDLPLFSFCWANSNKFNGKKPKLKAFNHLYSCRNFPDVCTFEVTWNFLHISMAMGQNLWYHIWVVIHIHLPAILMWTTGVQGFDPIPKFPFMAFALCRSSRAPLGVFCPKPQSEKWCGDGWQCCFGALDRGWCGLGDGNADWEKWSMTFVKMFIYHIFD